MTKGKMENSEVTRIHLADAATWILYVPPAAAILHTTTSRTYSFLPVFPFNRPFVKLGPVEPLRCAGTPGRGRVTDCEATECIFLGRSCQS